MNNSEEREAIERWVKALLAEAHGHKLPNYPVNETWYMVDQVRTTLLRHLPKTVVDRYIFSATEDFLGERFTEAELGTMLKAGAARFLMPEADGEA